MIIFYEQKIKNLGENLTCFKKRYCRGAANHSRVAEGTRPSPEGVYSGVS